MVWFLWKIAWRFAKTLHMESPPVLAAQLLGLWLREMETEVLTKTQTSSAAALFPTANGEKQANGPSADEWKDKMWSMHMGEYYLAMKRRDDLTPATRWVSLGNIMLSESSQTKKKTS